jgi:3-oxoacyl-[acyl-carrier-protein] synthase III
MGTTIDSAVVRHAGWRDRHSARRLADSAARACLARAGRTSREVDLLLNVGLYRDRNLGEPALAALIQEDIGANPEDPPAGGRGTFSFDLANGACGVLTALQVADGFLRAGTIERALVVASDADPGHRLSAEFPYAPTGGALLCRWADGGGLRAFHWATEPGTAHLAGATVSFDDGRHKLHVDRHASFGDVAVAWAAKAATALLDEQSMGPDDVDLVVLSPLGAGRDRQLAELVGVDAERVACIAAEPAPHTAGLIASLVDAEQSGRLTAARRIVLVAAGAGVTAGAALLER